MPKRILLLFTIIVSNPGFAEKGPVHFHPGSCTTGEEFYFTTPRSYTSNGSECPVLLKHNNQNTLLWVDLNNGARKCPKPGKDHGTCNASGSRNIDATVCNSNVTWLPANAGSTTVNSSGNFVYAPTADGTQTNFSFSCMGACSCQLAASNVFTSAQTACPSFTSLGPTSGNPTYTITKSNTGTNYVYLRMGPANVACNSVTSTDVLQCAWAGTSGGAWSCTQMSWCC
jgi:hypothetical protein